MDIVWQQNLTVTKNTERPNRHKCNLHHIPLKKLNDVCDTPDSEVHRAECTTAASRNWHENPHRRKEHPGYQPTDLPLR